MALVVVVVMMMRVMEMKVVSQATRMPNDDDTRYIVGMQEGVWKRVDRPGELANREHFLMALAGLEYIIVKVKHWKDK